MHPGVLAGIVGGAVGVAGGLLGTYFSIRNARSPAERAFAIRCAAGFWLAVPAFIALLLFTPAHYKWMIWVPYAVGLPLAIRWMNIAQARLHPSSDPMASVSPDMISSEFNRGRWFSPRFTGRVRFDQIPEDYIARLQRRVEEGFLVSGTRARANYIVDANGGVVQIVANDFSTALNIGLNDVRLRLTDGQYVSYEVDFTRWTMYSIALCASILGIVTACYFTVEFFSLPLPEAGGAPLGALATGVLCSVFWPLVLAEMHKKPAARCLERILTETLAS